MSDEQAGILVDTQAATEPVPSQSHNAASSPAITRSARSRRRAKQQGDSGDARGVGDKVHGPEVLVVAGEELEKLVVTP